jgi:hypothetical protein
MKRFMNFGGCQILSTIIAFEGFRSTRIGLILMGKLVAWIKNTIYDMGKKTSAE